MRHLVDGGSCSSAEDGPASFDRRYVLQTIQADNSRLDWTYSTDDVGNVITLDYDDAGRLGRIARAGGERVVTYDGRGFLDDVAPPTQSCNLDVDGDGGNGALTDGLLALRFFFGFEGSTLTGGAVGSGCTRCTAEEIEPYLADCLVSFDIDANSLTGPLTDGLLVLRYLFGFTGATLIDGAVGENCDRCTATEIEDYLMASSLVAVTPAPVYSSEGLLYVKGGKQVFYFAGRPIALGVTGAIIFLTTDHLGTPILAMDDEGPSALWSGGFEPFGRDPQEGSSSFGATENGVFLRLPGQWEDPIWESTTLGAAVYYNVHRWYEQQTGRYARPDPLRIDTNGEVNPYIYAYADPMFWIDPLGLAACQACADCPSGEWTYSGQGFSVAFIGGISRSKGTFTCKDNPRMQVPVKVKCGLGGPIIGGGYGFEGSTPFLPSACACNARDLIGRQPTTLVGSAGPFGAGVSSCGPGGVLSIGPRTLTVGLAKTWGAGLAGATCEVERRTD